MKHDGPHRSRGGAIHSRPEEKMGHEKPITFQIPAKGHPRIVRMLKNHANKKRRQRDRMKSDER